MTQDEMILKHLQTGQSITPDDAKALYGVSRLAAVIHRLRKNHSINAHEESCINRFGKRVYFARYRMAVRPAPDIKAIAEGFMP